MDNQSIKLRFVIIDEPIHVYDPIAVRLWQKALWAKELGYRHEYSTSILPMSTDDFFGSHMIVAEELANGDLEPIVMYKSVRRSQAIRFGVTFGAQALLKGTSVEGSPALQKILDDPSEVSYDSSWSVNPVYKNDMRVRRLQREYVTTIATLFHQSMGFKRWLTAGVVRFKIDQYFEYLGCKEIIGEFALPIIDNDTVRMFLHDGTPSVAAKAMADSHRFEWNNRLIFTPETANNQQIKKAA